MLEADFRQSHDEVRELAKKHADEGHEVMKEESRNFPLVLEE